MGSFFVGAGNEESDTVDHLALDVGGANIKLADGRGMSRSVPFALWRHPQRLAETLAELLCEIPPAARLSVTMTGELADCFETKRHGLRAIVSAVGEAAGAREMRVFTTAGQLIKADEAMENPLPAAAANWLALATWAGRHAPQGSALLLDVGSTTCDVIPLVDGRPAATGLTDTERLLSGELVYTGVRRSPVCAVAATLPHGGRECPVAQELFATSGDAHVILGNLPESESGAHTADGRPATRSAARDRLARCICADRETFSEDDASEAAQAIARKQLAMICAATEKVVSHLGATPERVVISGEGEFLARRVVERVAPAAALVSLRERLGPEVSQCATAHALAVLAREDFE